MMIMILNHFGLCDSGLAFLLRSRLKFKIHSVSFRILLEVLRPFFTVFLRKIFLVKEGKNYNIISIIIINIYLV